MNYWDRESRRYVDFRARFSARGGIPATTPTNFGTLALFNNSDQYVLVVRGWFYGSATLTPNFGFGQTNSRLTGTPGTVNPVTTTGATPPGLVDYSDQAAALAVDITLNVSSATVIQGTVDLPFACILPGWSFYMTALAKAKITSGGFQWDWCTPDEL